jgi:hypothetical protein
MRITLNQNEIQQALRNYVNELISVGEGMVVTVTLDDNASALVEILPEGEEPNGVTPPVVERAPRQQRRTKAEMAAATAPAEVVVAPVVAAEVPVVETAVVVPVVVEKEVEVAPVEPEAVAEVATPVAEAVVETAPTTEAPRASLFANLRKPVNA